MDPSASFCTHASVEVGEECPVQAFPSGNYGSSPDLKFYEFFFF